MDVFFWVVIATLFLAGLAVIAASATSVFFLVKQARRSDDAYEEFVEEPVNDRAANYPIWMSDKR